MYSLIQPWLFKMDAEKAHRVALSALHCAPSLCFAKPVANPVRALGMDFPHPVGLAAGLDKNGGYLDALSKIGFSHIEIGTVTPKPQVGNPKPRLFRVPSMSGIVNRMGFNNDGVLALVANLKKARYKGIIGVNIGKNKDTLLSKAIDDYLYCFQAVYPYVSYVTLNVSSPNTPDLRQLQQEQYFSALLERLKEEQKVLEDKHQRHVPLVIKISPDEDLETLKEMCDTMLKAEIEGIIATNTTVQRNYFEHLPSIMSQGGMSGRPLTHLSTACLRVLKSYVGDAITLIGVGGIFDRVTAQEKINAGASLVQVYTGLIYQGPKIVNEISRELILPVNKPNSEG